MSHSEQSSSASRSSSWRSRQPSNRMSNMYAPSPASSAMPGSFGPASLASLKVSEASSVLPSTAPHVFNNNKTPTHAGVPVTTIAATSISLGLNAICIILILSLDCPLKANQVSHFLAFLVIAELCLAFMLYSNFRSHRYHYTWYSLTLSWLYSGSACLLIYGMVMMLVQGFCAPNGQNESFILSGLASDFSIFIMTGFSVVSQLVAHYYYG